MAKNKATGSKESTQQKTIHDFFKLQNGKQSQIIKISCPACGMVVLQSKLNLHLDSDCSSKQKTKGKKCVSKKRVQQTKNTPGQWLYDSDDDYQEDFQIGKKSPELFDFLPEEDVDTDSDSEVYFSSSMVETQLAVEDDGNKKINDLRSDWDSPEKVAKDGASNSKEMEGNDNLINNNEPGTRKTSLSFSSSDEDFDDSSFINTSKLSDAKASNACTTVTKMESYPHKLPCSDESSREWQSPDDRRSLVSPQRTPTPSPSTSAKSNSHPSPNIGKSIHKTEDDDDDDFEDENIVFRTPKKSPYFNKKHSLSVSPNKIKSSPVTPKKTPEMEKKSTNGLFDKDVQSVALSPDLNYSLNRFAHSDELKLLSQSTHNSNKLNATPIKSPQTPRSMKKMLKNTSMLNNSSPKIKVRRNLILDETKQPEASTSSPSKTNNNLHHWKDKSDFRNVQGMYLENFLQIINSVYLDEANANLFNEDDIDVINTFSMMSLEGQKLYVRLFMRKLKWNRAEKIEYKDICDKGDTSLYLKELTYAGYLQDERSLDDLGEVLSLLVQEEIKNLCKEMKLPSTGKKADLVTSLLKFRQEQKSALATFMKSGTRNNVVLTKAKKFLNNCYLVNKEKSDVFRRTIMLYSLPIYDDEEDTGGQSQLTTLLMVGLGKLKFPSYEIKRNLRIFRNRDDLVRFEGFCQLESDVKELMEAHKWEEAEAVCDIAEDNYKELVKDEAIMSHELSLPSFLRRFTCISILIYLMSCKVEVYQKLRNYGKAVDTLRMLLQQKTHLQDYRGRWYDRLALNLQQHLKKPALAIQAIKEALQDNEIRVGHRLALSNRAQKMAESSRYDKYSDKLSEIKRVILDESPTVSIEGRCLPSDIPGQKRVYISDDSMGNGMVLCSSVEEYVIGHYKGQGFTEGLHREGAAVNSLFGLLFWDCIYATVEDVFLSNHQAVPLDLDSPHFYSSRKEIIENRLYDLRNNLNEIDVMQQVRNVWETNIGTTTIVNWDIFRDLEQVEGLIACLGLHLLTAICERLAKDHRFTRSGFPDLIMWDPKNKRSRIVEVKGPNDKLSTKQILWIDYLNANGGTAEVCYVTEIGAKRLKKELARKVINKSPKKQDCLNSSGNFDINLEKEYNKCKMKKSPGENKYYRGQKRPKQGNNKSEAYTKKRRKVKE